MKASLCICILSFFLIQNSYAQRTGISQQIAVAKILKPGLTTIAILSSTLDDKGMDAWTRYGLAQGITILIGRPKAIGEIASLYRKMVKEKGAQVILIPDADDEMMTGIGFEYLRESALSDRIGVFAPQESLVTNGALCFITTESGKLKVFVNQRIASVIGANVPAENGSSVTYVVK